MYVLYVFYYNVKYMEQHGKWQSGMCPTFLSDITDMEGLKAHFLYLTHKPTPVAMGFNGFRFCQNIADIHRPADKYFKCLLSTTVKGQTLLSCFMTPYKAR